MTDRRHGPPSYEGTCTTHDKRLWYSKKDAKKAARIHHPSERLTPYRCDAHEDRWHYGHMHSLVISRGVDMGVGGRH